MIMKNLILLLALITISFFSIAQDEWTKIHPYFTDSDLIDAHFVSDMEGWAVGTGGLIMHTTDACETWEIQHSNPNESLWSIYFIDDNEGWAVGWGRIYHTTNAGETWETQQCPGVIGDLRDVYFLDSENGWIVGTYQIVLRTTDGGQTWTKTSNTLPGKICFSSICFTDELHGCLVGGPLPGMGGIVKITEDGGETWIETTPTDNEFYEKIFFKESGEGWICGEDGALEKTMDGGLTWEDMSFGPGQNQDIYFWDDNKGIIFGFVGVNLTFDGGQSWDSTVYIGNYPIIEGTACWGNNGAITLNWDKSIYKSTDGGSTWESMNQNLQTTIQQIGFFNPQNGFVIAGDAEFRDLFATTNGGQTWQYNTLIQNGPFYRIWLSGSSCYLLNPASQMMKTNDAGEVWQLVDVPGVASEYFGLQFVNDNTGFMCSSGGKFVKTIDGGETWIDKSVAGDPYFEYMFFLDENKGWLSDTQGKQIYRTEDGGNSWEITSLNFFDDYTPQNIFFVNEEVGYATTFENLLFKSSDGGETWQSCHDFQSGYISNLHFISETEGWVTNGETVYHTFDGGITWDDGQSFEGTLEDIFFLNDELGWVCGDGGIIANYDITAVTVGLNESGPISNQVLLIPNPSNNEISVSTNNESELIKDINVFDVYGQQVLHFQDVNKPASFTFDISALNKGAYILQLKTDKGQELIKFIKQ
jgi:photosystem II stability/assembly factor-like uncharacterized protein